MKREGRQHGMVRTIMVLPSPFFYLGSEPRHPRRPVALPTAGSFTRVSSKPTNHSKFTAKCTGKSKCSCCHLQPSNKSKDKSKGAKKLKMVSWRDVDERPGLLFAGSSASGVLSHLDGGYDHSEEDDDDDDDIDQEQGYDESCAGALQQDGLDLNGMIQYDDDHENDLDVDHQDDDFMSFCEVGFVWEQIDGDESWCLVGEL